MTFLTDDVIIKTSETHNCLQAISLDTSSMVDYLGQCGKLLDILLSGPRLTARIDTPLGVVYDGKDRVFVTLESSINYLINVDLPSDWCGVYISLSDRPNRLYGSADLMMMSVYVGTDQGILAVKPSGQSDYVIEWSSDLGIRANGFVGLGNGIYVVADEGNNR